MKKLLAMVLALVMTMSLVTISSNAAFSDASEIEHTEAVEVLNSLGVIAGMGDGNFAPKGNVTRSQMAKMITVIMLGDVNVDAFKGIPTDLTDINDWAEGYVKYCYSQGIIAGKGAGMFDGNANVTATEAAKMLLVAIGYNASVQGYTGAAWAINVARDAQMSGFYDDLTVGANVALSRDQAAQMIYNAVQAKMIEKTPTLTVGTNELSYHYVPSTTKTLLSETFSTKEYVGVMDVPSYASSNKEYTYGEAINGAFENKNNNLDTVSSFKSKTDYTSFIGEEVSMIIKTAKNGDKSVLGVYATGKSTVLNTAVSAIELSGAKLKIDGVKYEVESPLTTSAVVDTDSYNVVKLVDVDGNGKFEVQVPTAINPAKVTFVSDKEVIAGGTTYKFADDEIPEGLAKNDYVTVIAKVNGTKVLTKIEKISGKVDAVKTINTESCVRIDGAWYAKNGETMNVDSTYTFYAVNGVVVSDSVDASSADIANLIMVVATDTEMLTTKAMVLKADGTTATVTVDSNGASATPGAMYTYTETDKGYKLTAAADIGSDYDWNAGGDSDIATAISKFSTIGSVGVTDDALIFIKSTDGGKVITGKQFKNLAASLLDTSATFGDVAANKVWDTSCGYYTSVKNGLTRVTYAGVQLNGLAKNLGVNSGNDKYAYVVTASYTVEKGYTTYNIWDGENTVEVIDKGATSLAKGDVILYDTVADGYITNVVKQTIVNTVSADITDAKDTVSIQGIEGKYVYLDGVASTNAAKLVDDTAYLYVDSGAEKSDEIGKAAGEVVRADKYDGTNYRDNAIAIVNASDEVVLLVIDVKGSMTVAANKTLDVGSAPSNFTVSVSGADAAKIGDAIEITCNADSQTITVTGAVDAEGNAVSSHAMNDGDKIVSVKWSGVKNSG